MTQSPVSPEEAKRLLDDEEYAYLDVRSVPEFGAGHPPGAYNIPLMNAGSGGMKANPHFVEVASRTFDKDAKLVVGCKMGGRSKRAVEALTAAGFTHVVDCGAGFEGKTDPFAKVQQPGWRVVGLPVATTPEQGHDYASLAEAAGVSEPGDGG